MSPRKSKAVNLGQSHSKGSVKEGRNHLRFLDGPVWAPTVARYLIPLRSSFAGSAPTDEWLTDGSELICRAAIGLWFIRAVKAEMEQSSWVASEEQPTCLQGICLWQDLGILYCCCALSSRPRIYLVSITSLTTGAGRLQSSFN